MGGLTALAGCTGGGDDTGGDSDGDGGTTESSGDGGDGGDTSTTEDEGDGGEPKVLRIPLIAEPRTLEPNNYSDLGANHVGNALYEGLLGQSPSGELEPRVARDFPESPDPTTYVFELRENVMSASGEAITAEDVKASVDWVLNPDNNSVRRGLHEIITGVEVVDDLTVRFTLGSPWAPFLKLLGSARGFNVVTAESREEPGPDTPYTTGPQGIGTGPFDMVEWNAGSEIVLERNENYWADDLPPVDRVEMPIIEEESTRLTRFRGGNLDVLIGPAPKDVPSLRQDSSVVHGSAPSVVMNTLWFATDQEPFDDWRVRRAVVHAIDNQEWIDKAYRGLAVPAVGYAPPDTDWHDSSLSQYSEYDLDKAKTFVDDSDYSDVEFELMTEAGPWSSTSQILAQSLSEIGITANVQEYTHAALFGQRKDQNKPGAVLQNVPNRMFDWGFMLVRQAWHPKGDISYIAKYVNEDLQGILGQYLEATERSQQVELFKQAQAICAEQAPFVYNTHTQVNQFWQPSVQNYEVFPARTPILRSVDIER